MKVDHTFLVYLVLAALLTRDKHRHYASAYDGAPVLTQSKQHPYPNTCQLHKSSQVVSHRSTELTHCFILCIVGYFYTHHRILIFFTLTEKRKPPDLSLKCLSVYARWRNVGAPDVQPARGGFSPGWGFFIFSRHHRNWKYFDRSRQTF